MDNEKVIPVCQLALSQQHKQCQMQSVVSQNKYSVIVFKQSF